MSSKELTATLTQSEWDLIDWALRYVETDTDDDMKKVSALSDKLTNLGLV